MKKFILAGLLLASGQMALAANWVSTGISSDVLKETIEVDYDSISAYHFNSYDKDSYYVGSIKKSYVNTHSSSNWWDKVRADTIGEDVSEFICGVYDTKSKS